MAKGRAVADRSSAVRVDDPASQTPQLWRLVEAPEGMLAMTEETAPWWSRLLCLIGLHPRDRLTEKATCADCGRFLL